MLISLVNDINNQSSDNIKPHIQSIKITILI